MFTLEQIVDGFNKNPRLTKALMVKEAYHAIICHFENCATLEDVEVDKTTINYSEITSWLGWPDFQDGGVFEKAIDIAAAAAMQAYWNEKPDWA